MRVRMMTTLMVALCCLILVTQASGQSDIKLYRISAEETRLIFPKPVERLDKIKVLFPDEGLVEATSFQLDNQNKAKLTLRLPSSDKIERLIAEKRQPYIYLPEVKLKGEDDARHDQLVAIPGFTVSINKVVDERDMVVLEQVYVPDKLISTTKDPDAWVIKSGQKRYDVQKVTDPREIGNGLRRRLILKRPLPSNAKGTISLQPPTGDALPIGKFGTGAIERGEENLFLGFTLANSGGRDTIFGAKIKAQYDLWRGFLESGGVHLKLTPRFNMKASSGDQDDENSLDFSLALAGRKVLGRVGEAFQTEGEATGKSTNPFESIAFYGAAKFESDRQFDNENIVFDGEFRLFPKTFGSKNKKTGTGVKFDPQVFVGVEAGNNIKNVVRVLDGRRVMRLKAGADVAVVFELQRPNLNSITLSSSFIHRQLFEPERFTEVISGALPAGVLIPDDPSLMRIVIPRGSASLRRTALVTVSEGPRNYVDTSLSFDFKRSFDFYISYLNGELPPTFERVKKIEMGFAFRLGRFRNRF